MIVVVHTCDKYEFLWEGWNHYFKKYWKSDIPVYFMNEEKDVDFAPQIKTGKGEWSDRLIKGLKSVPDEHIIYMQEDFWLQDTIDIETIIELFLQKDMNCLRIHESLLNTRYYSVEPTDVDNLYKFTNDSNYLVSHQFSIWNKEFFLSCLKPNESPWVNEKAGTKRIQGVDNKIYGYNLHWYDAVCRKGKLTDRGKELQNEI